MSASRNKRLFQPPFPGQFHVTSFKTSIHQLFKTHFSQSQTFWPLKIAVLDGSLTFYGGFADQAGSGKPELLNLSSNNPFRKPSFPSAEGNAECSRTASTNPFLSTNEHAALSQSPQRSSFDNMTARGIRANHGQTSLTTTMDDLFVS